jgi:probable HAF family extracellular repeat protein
MRNKASITLVMLGSALLSLSAAAAAPALKYTFKNVNAPKAVETDTYAINNKGVIAGDWADSAGNQHGLILAGKKATSVDDKNCGAAAGASAIAFYGINTAGTAVGWCTLTSTGEPTGLMYAKGKLTEFSVPKALETEAIGINDKGAIVGMFVDSAGAQHGFLLSGKKYTQIDAPKDNTTEAWDINNAGQITVYALNSAGTYDAFVLTGKTYKKISAPGSASPGTIVHALNNKGDVDGTYYDSAGVTHGFLLHGGKYYTLNDPAGADTRADGLNDSMDVVGRWGAGTYGGTGFEAKP